MSIKLPKTFSGGYMEKLWAKNSFWQYIRWIRSKLRSRRMLKISKNWKILKFIKYHQTRLKSQLSKLENHSSYESILHS